MSSIARTTRRDVNLNLPPILYLDLPSILKYLTILSATVFALIEGLLVYRFGAQLMSARPDAAPLIWAYNAAGAFARPFQHLDGTQLQPDAPFIEFSVLVAIEAFLVTGLLLAGSLYALMRFARIYTPNPLVIRTAPLYSAVERVDGWLRQATLGARSRYRAWPYTRTLQRPLAPLRAQSIDSLRDAATRIDGLLSRLQAR